MDHGKMTVRCNSKQLQAILKDFEDASVAVDVSYGTLHKGTTDLNMFYDDQEDGIVAGIVKFRMKNNEKKTKTKSIEEAIIEKYPNVTIHEISYSKFGTRVLATVPARNEFDKDHIVEWTDKDTPPNAISMTETSERLDGMRMNKTNLCSYQDVATQRHF